MKIVSKTEATIRYAQMQNELGKTKESRPPASKDSISISPAARLLQECLSAEEPFDQDKVSAIKSALAQGRYQTDHIVLAEKLFTEMSLQRGNLK
ncbi:MAG: flagellar biosynthesis anti-sigma factor FlgM [Bacillota bacterium]|nr:flagellar biosynthesis anti-sigma factor FlgM [Bacillota bacterium]